MTGRVRDLVVDDEADLKVVMDRNLGGNVLERWRPRMTDVSL